MAENYSLLENLGFCEKVAKTGSNFKWLALKYQIGEKGGKRKEYPSANPGLVISCLWPVL